MRPNKGIIGAIADTFGSDYTGIPRLRKYTRLIGGIQQGDTGLIDRDSDEKFALGEPSQYRLYDGFYGPKNVVRDDVFYQTSLLINANARRTFVDDLSPNGLDISIAGDTKPAAFQPFGGNWSVYFDGSSYLSLGASNDNTIGTQACMVEAWVYRTTSSAGYVVCSHQIGGMFYFAVNANGTIGWALNHSGGSSSTSSGATSTGTVPVGQWTHIAGVRVASSTEMRIYINGVLDTTGNMSGTNVGSYGGAKAFYIGAGPDTTTKFTGYLAGVRYVLGDEVYTGSSFDLPEAPVGFVTGTRFAVCNANYYYDTVGAYSTSVSTSGTIKVKANGPYEDPASLDASGSGYFDGSGDYLTVTDDASFDFGTDPFTFEAWIYLTANNDAVLVDARSLGSNGFVISPRSDGTIEFDVAGNNILNGTIVRPLNTWAHVVICKDSSDNISLFINGKRDVTTTSTASVDAATDIYIGSKSLGSSGLVAITGYISNLRFIKGTAIYDPTQTTLTIPTTTLTAIAGTSLLTLTNRYGSRNNHTTDTSENRNLVRLINQASSGTFSPSSTRSWALATGPGSSGTYRYINGNGAVNVGSEDFTWECWFLREGIKSFDTLISQAAAGSVIMRISGGGFGGAPSPNTIISNASVTAGNGKWVHMAYSRKDGAIYSHINGYPGNPGLSTGGYNWTGSNMRVGNYNNNTNQEWPGYISAIRVVRGRHVYEPNVQYDVPIEPFLPVEGTTFLCYQDPYEMDTSVTNEHSYAGGGTPATVPIMKLFNNLPLREPLGYSVGFRGGTTYAYTPAGSSANIIGTASLSTSTTMTIEGWVHIGAYAASDYGAFIGDMLGTTGTNYWSFGANTTGYPNLYWYDGAAKRCTGDIKIEPWTWTHVAVVVDNSDIKLFVNGNLCNNSGTTTLTNTTGSLGNITIGGYNNSGLSGGLHDLMVSNIARYSSSFTVPTGIANVHANTTLYLSGSSSQVVDNGPFNFDLTSVGYRTGPSEQNPWGWQERSSYLPVEYKPEVHGGGFGMDGTDDYAVVTLEQPFMNGDYTIELCVYMISTAGSPIFYDARSTGTQYAPTIYLNSASFAYYVNGADRIVSADVPAVANKWYHIAVTRKDGVHKMFVNGRQIGATWTDTSLIGHYQGSTNSVVIGASYTGTNDTNGYISGVRTINGTSLYNGNFIPPRDPPTKVPGTILLLNFDDVPIQDETARSILMAPTAVDLKPLESVGTGRRGRGMYFNGSNYLYLKQPFNTQNYPLNLDTSDFTVECWFYSFTTNAIRYIIDARSSEQTSGWALILYNNGTIDWYNSSVERYFGSYSANTWHHVAVTRESGTVRMFLDGVLESTATGDTVYHNSGSTPSIGQRYGGTDRFYGYIDDFRVVRGTAKYTAGFVPPARTYLLR